MGISDFYPCRRQDRDCSAIIERNVGGTPVIPDTGAKRTIVITQLGIYERERRKSAAEKRMQSRTARTQPHPISEQRRRNAFLSELNAMGVHPTKNEYRIIDAMTTDKLLKARQVENIIKPLIQRREGWQNKAYPQE